MIGLLMLLHLLTAAFGTEPEYHRVRCDGGDQGSSRPRLNVRQTTQMSSRPGEFHPQALPEPCMTLSSHTAPDVRPSPWHSGQ